MFSRLVARPPDWSRAVRTSSNCATIAAREVTPSFAKMRRKWVDTVQELILSTVRTLAAQTLRVLGSRQQAAQAFRRSQQLDRHFHRVANGQRCAKCQSCGARVR